MGSWDDLPTFPLRARPLRLPSGLRAFHRPSRRSPDEPFRLAPSACPELPIACPRRTRAPSPDRSAGPSARALVRARGLRADAPTRLPVQHHRDLGRRTRPRHHRGADHGHAGCPGDGARRARARIRGCRRRQRVPPGHASFPGDERGLSHLFRAECAHARHSGGRPAGRGRADSDLGGGHPGRHRDHFSVGAAVAGAPLLVGSPGGRCPVHRGRHEPRPRHLPAGAGRRAGADPARVRQHRDDPRVGGHGLRGPGQLSGLPRRRASLGRHERGLPRVRDRGRSSGPRGRARRAHELRLPGRDSVRRGGFRRARGGSSRRTGPRSGAAFAGDRYGRAAVAVGDARGGGGHPRADAQHAGQVECNIGSC